MPRVVQVVQSAQRSFRRTACLTVVVLCSLSRPLLADPSSKLRGLERAAGVPLRVVRSERTGLATFIATAAGRPIPLPASASAGAEGRARAFLDSFGSAFGVEGRSDVRVRHVDPPDRLGFERVRLQQLHRGVPIAGAEIAVHLRGAAVSSATAKTLPIEEPFGLAPGIDASAALEKARALLAKHRGVTDAQLSEPRLEILNRGLLEGGRRRPTRLTWHLEATGPQLRELIWIDAQSGAVALYFSQLAHGLERAVYNAGSISILPGSLLRIEGDPPTGDADADAAYDASGDFHAYLLNEHGRDGFDDAGGRLVSSVHYCDTFCGCPCLNAFWNGFQVVYGNGFSRADDVVAHEWTHALIDHTAALYYYMQSGALNESYADIFGETVDLLNGTGTDGKVVRWQLGEDLPVIGVLRGMFDPTGFGDPGKMSDPQLSCDDPGDDGGGVHTNSGIANHAYALMADGGSFNGFTVSGIGLVKAGKIQYRALTSYLLSASDFLDNYNALVQSCADLIGTDGISAADCTEVAKALEAVEMADPLPCSAAQAVALELCPAGSAPVTFFFDDFESGAERWDVETFLGADLWFLGSWFATSGVGHLFGADPGGIADSAVMMLEDVTVPAGARLQFEHSYGFENASGVDYDGGVLEYSTDGGDSWLDAGALIVAGAGYGGTLSDCCSNPLANRAAFVRDSFGYTASQLDLSSLEGQEVRFRFRIGSDEGVERRGMVHRRRAHLPVRQRGSVVADRHRKSHDCVYCEREPELHRQPNPNPDSHPLCHDHGNAQPDASSISIRDCDSQRDRDRNRDHPPQSDRIVQPDVFSDHVAHADRNGTAVAERNSGANAPCHRQRAPERHRQPHCDSESNRPSVEHRDGNRGAPKPDTDRHGGDEHAGAGPMRRGL